MSGESAKTSITVIGLGAMGVVLAQALQQSGHSLTVWNRTPERGASLVMSGATRAASAAAAISMTNTTVICLNDTASVQSLLGLPGVEDALTGRTLINLTTLAGTEAQALADWAKHRGIRFLQGGINGYPRDVGKRDTSIIYAGDKAAFEELKSTLAAMAGAQIYLGSNPANVATMYLALWTFYFTALLGFFEAAGLAAQTQFSLEDFGSMIHSIIVPRLTDGLEDAVARIKANNLGSDQGRIGNTANALREFPPIYQAAGLSGKMMSAVGDYLLESVSSGNGDKNIAGLYLTVSKKVPP